jgi:nicotinamide-nucleotide amidase
MLGRVKTGGAGSRLGAGTCDVRAPLAKRHEPRRAMTETLSAALPAEVEAKVFEVLQLASDGGFSLVTAESCTGGLVASVLTDVEGLGHAFERGFVVYANTSKTEMLGVPDEMLAAHSAVSEPVARAMAEGALEASHGDLAIAVTGYAGPAGPGQPQGLVHFALARRGGRTEHRVETFGPVSRGEGRLASLKVALEMLSAALG